MILFDRMFERLRTTRIGAFFLERSFFHYFWTGGLFMVLNILLVWIAIDMLDMPTLPATTVVIGGLFIARYVVYRFLNVM